MSPGVEHALRAIFWGSFAGGAPLLPLTVPIGLVTAFTDGSPEMLLFALVPWLVSLAFVVPAFLLLCLPLTSVLRGRPADNHRSYVIAGLFAGIIFPTVIGLLAEGLDVSFALGGLFLGLFGAVAGGVTGYVWGSWREVEASLGAEAASRAFE